MSPAMIEVQHLASSASFYAAITQPFGIQYLSSSQTTSRTAALNFGFTATSSSTIQTVLTLVKSECPEPTIISFRANSMAIVKDFIDIAIEAAGAHFDVLETLKVDGEVVTGTVHDDDGNLLEVKYDACSINTSPNLGSAPVENWRTYVDVVYGSVERPVRHATNPSCEAGPVLSTSSVFLQQNKRRHTSSLISGISNQTLIGTLLGTAAGAAVAYAIVSSELPSSSVSRTEKQNPQDKSRVGSGKVNTTNGKSEDSQSCRLPRPEYSARDNYVHVEERVSGVGARIHDSRQDMQIVMQDNEHLRLKSVNSVDKDKAVTVIASTVLDDKVKSLEEKDSNAIVPTPSKISEKANDCTFSKSNASAPTELSSTTAIRPLAGTTAPSSASYNFKTRTRQSENNEESNGHQLIHNSHDRSHMNTEKLRHKHFEKATSNIDYSSRSQKKSRLENHPPMRHRKNKSSNSREGRDQKQERDETLVEVYPLPLPVSSSRRYDKVAHAVAGIEALHVPLPASTISHPSRNSDGRTVFEEPRKTGSSYTIFSDPFSDSKALGQQSFDAGSIAPSDSVSCAGSKKERIRRVEKVLKKDGMHNVRK